jgi:PST family polysaccharide transporter
MQLIRTSALSALSTFIKIIVGLISIKIVALYTGPSGIAILGQFMGFVNILSVIAGGGITLGIIKYVAEYANSEMELKGFLSNAFSFTLFFSLITLGLGVGFSKELAYWILGSEIYSNLIVWLALTQLFMTFNLLFCAIINGFGDIKRLVLINSLSSVLGLTVMVGMVGHYGLMGALLGFMMVQCMGFFVALAMVFREKWLKLLFLFSWKKIYLSKLFRYSVMNIISILALPLSQILVRNDLSHLFGWGAVGYWQAVARISDAYLLFITMTLTSYYLPRLSELKDAISVKQEIAQAYRIIMPAIFVMLLALYLLRHFIVLVLYTPKFSPAENLFLFQYLGDFFRIAGWLFTYLLLAKAMMKTYIITEIVLALGFVFASHIMVRQFGLIGVAYAFAATYLFYWLIMAIITRFYFKMQEGQCLPVSSL